MWQPIETAPKDGAVVLISGGDLDAMGVDDTGMAMASFDDWLHNSWALCGGMMDVVNPTKWMPLPKPPQN